MNFSNSFRAQIEAVPGGTFIAQTFASLMDAIRTGYGVQHNADDTHSTITATGSISERGRTVPMGAWIYPAFDATAFTVAGASNTWVVSAPTDTAKFYLTAYTLVGNTMTLNLFIPDTTLTITTATPIVTVALPPGFRVAGMLVNSAFVGAVFVSSVFINNGSDTTGRAIAEPGATTISINGVANFVTDSAFTIEGQLVLDVVAI